MLIFKWYTTEAISPGQIAARLNDLGVSPVYGPLWHRGVVKYILTNPVYTGRPVYNKASNSRFMEFVDGQVKTANRTKASRKRAEPDQIRPEDNSRRSSSRKFSTRPRPSWPPRRSGPTVPPTRSSMWLKGFVVCGKCGKPMRIARRPRLPLLQLLPLRHAIAAADTSGWSTTRSSLWCSTILSMYAPQVEGPHGRLHSRQPGGRRADLGRDR